MFYFLNTEIKNDETESSSHRKIVRFTKMKSSHPKLLNDRILNKKTHRNCDPSESGSDPAKPTSFPALSPILCLCELLAV